MAQGYTKRPPFVLTIRLIHYYSLKLADVLSRMEQLKQLELSGTV